MAVVVVTRIAVREGVIDEVARRFEEANRPLVEGQIEWLGAWFTADRERSEVTNIAHWRSAAAYERLRDSEAFRTAMAGFADVFAGPPEVTVNEVLVEMRP